MVFTHERGHTFDILPTNKDTQKQRASLFSCFVFKFAVGSIIQLKLSYWGMGGPPMVVDGGQLPQGSEKHFHAVLFNQDSYWVFIPHNRHCILIWFKILVSNFENLQSFKNIILKKIFFNYIVLTSSCINSDVFVAYLLSWRKR